MNDPCNMIECLYVDIIWMKSNKTSTCIYIYTYISMYLICSTFEGPWYVSAQTPLVAEAVQHYDRRLRQGQ